MHAILPSLASVYSAWPTAGRPRRSAGSGAYYRRGCQSVRAQPAIAARRRAFGGKRLLPVYFARVSVNDEYLVRRPGTITRSFTPFGVAILARTRGAVRLLSAFGSESSLTLHSSFRVLTILASEVRLGFIPAGALGVASERSPAASPELGRREQSVTPGELAAVSRFSSAGPVYIRPGGPVKRPGWTRWANHGAQPFMANPYVAFGGCRMQAKLPN